MTLVIKINAPPIPAQYTHREGRMSITITIKYSQSAFKHSVSEVSIEYAVINALFDDILDDVEDKHLLIGFDDNGNLLEILYNVLDDDTIRIFHAMKCRDAFSALLKRS